jgi:hypothetical protein
LFSDYHYVGQIINSLLRNMLRGVRRRGGLRDVASCGNGGAGSGRSVIAAVAGGCPAGGVPLSTWQADHLGWWRTGLVNCMIVLVIIDLTLTFVLFRHTQTITCTTITKVRYVI